MASNPLFCFHPFEDIMEKIQADFQGWEFLAEKEHGWNNRDKIVDALSTSDMVIQVHAPFNDINISSMNTQIRKASIKEVVKSFDLAVLLDVGMITVHPGLYSPLAKAWGGTTKSLLESLDIISDEAEERNIKVALENMPAGFPTTGVYPDEIASFIESSDLGFCLDVGHAFTAGALDEFLTFDPINVHLHDNDGSQDLHLSLGDGKIDFEMVLDRLEDYGGNWVIEGRSLDKLKLSKEYLIDRLSTK